MSSKLTVNTSSHKETSNKEMPREKLIQQGALSLSNAELLAIFLRTGTPGMNVLDLAEYLIQDFGSLRALFAASQEEFCRHKGLGEAKYVQLQAVIEMTKRYLSEGLARGDALVNSQQTKLYLLSLLRDRQRETFFILYLDNGHRIISEEVLFEGTIDSASVHPREVVKRVLYHNAAAIIVAHNHPSGLSEPSIHDKRVTKRLVEALALIDVRILDHFIIGDDVAFSFAENGLMGHV